MRDALALNRRGKAPEGPSGLAMRTPRPAARVPGLLGFGGGCSLISTCFHHFPLVSGVFTKKIFFGVSAVGWPGAGWKNLKNA
jgi:hypothetical protein